MLCLFILVDNVYTKIVIGMKKMNMNEKEKERSYEKVILDTLTCPYAKLIAALTSGTLLHQTSSQEILQNL